MEQTKKQNDTFDIAKFILALFITILHLVTFRYLGKIGQFAFPILRTAVPLFFMLSSYFFFKKLRNSPDSEHNKYLGLTIHRNLVLYLFWMVILWLPIVPQRDYFSHGIIHGIKIILWTFFTGSTFSASWYIMALLIGLTLVYWLSRHADNHVILTLGIITYIICVLISNYGNLYLIRKLFWMPLWQWPMSWTPFNSFPVSFLWIGLGKLFAEKPNFGYLGSNSRQLTWIGISLLALYAEQTVITFFNLSFRNDCYFLLVPVCILVFGWIMHLKTNFKWAKELRAFSTVTYCLHLTLNTFFIQALLKAGLMHWTFTASIARWFIIVVLCAVVTGTILVLERIPGLRWLRFSH